MTENTGFYGWKPRGTADVEGLGVQTTPGFYYPHRMIVGVFTAGLDAVRARLPSEELHPVRWGRGRAALMVFGAYYPCISNPDNHPVDSFGEAGVLAVVTHGRHDAPPYVPLLGLPVPEPMTAGMFALHMPITSRRARDLGRFGFGIPKFMADITYQERDTVDRVVVEEDGALVFAIAASTTGRPHTVDEVGIQYCDLNGQLMRYELRESGTRRQDRTAGSATLELGDHPVAEDLRSLGVDTKGIASISCFDRRAIICPPTVIGPAHPRHQGYEGADREFGRAVVSHGPGLDLEMPTTRSVVP